MLIQEQPNRWSCVLAAFATATDIPILTLIEALGHDGSEIVFEDLEDPFCRRAFNLDEMALCLYAFGFVISNYDVEPLSIHDEDHMFTLDMEAYFPEIMTDSIGVGCGRLVGTDKTHAFAWDGKMCYDPTGFIYPLSKYELYSFSLITKRLYKS